MRQVIVLSLLGAGIAYASLHQGSSTADREAQVAAVTRIVAQGTMTDGAPTVYAEQPNLRQPVTVGPALPSFDAPASGMISAGVTAPPPAAPASPDSGSWTTQVAVPPVTAPSKSVTASSEQSRRKLARALQAELKRVGCYGGRNDGDWDAPSRAAMSEFVSRVNAALPVAEPDVILLALVRGHRSAVCGLQCGAGEFANAGRCISRTVVAQAPVTAEPVRARQPLPGRMSIGGPAVTDSMPVPTSVPRTVPAEVLPWQKPAGVAESGNDPRRERLAALPDEIASPHLEANNRPVASDRSLTRENDFAAPPPRRAAKPYRAKPAVAAKPIPRQVQRRKQAARSVQQLFLHPLGRM